MQTILANRVKRQLERHSVGENGPSREDLIEWYEQQRAQNGFKADEAAELRQVLGLEPSLEEEKFRHLVPDDTWFAELMDVQGESESPAPFFFLAALTVFSNLVGRKVMIDRGNHRLGVDCSAMLISPAGRGRRSTACDFVVYDIGEPAKLFTIADSFTYEAMGEALVWSAKAKPTRANPRIVGAQALIYAGEMSVLLGKGSYGDSIIPKLTDICGKTSRFNWHTVKRGKLEFVSPFVNCLFTSAPDWLVDNIPAVAFGGGMLSRFLICVRDQPEQVVTWAQPVSTEAKQRLIAGLMKRAGEARGIVPAPIGEVYKWYDDWYQTHSKKTLYGELPDERMAPYFSRKHDHLLRMATLLTLAAGEQLVLTIKRLEQALRIIDWLEMDIPKAYENMALSPLAAAQRELIKKLMRAGGSMEIQQLKRKMNRSLPLKEQFDAVVRGLLDNGTVKEVRGVGTRSLMIERRTI